MAGIGFPDILKGFRLWGAKSTTIQPAANQAQDISYRLPPSLPGTKQYLTCDENGHLAWEAIAESLPAHLYYFHAGDCPDSGSVWESRSGAIANSLTAQNGNLLKTGAGSSAYVAFSRNNWALFSQVPSLAAFVAVVQFEPPTTATQYCIFADGTDPAAAGSGNAISSNLASTLTVVPANWRNCQVWSNGTHRGIASATTHFEVGAWQKWGIILATGNSPLFQYENIGRDRTFNEFRGKLKALVGLVSQPSNDEISAWFSHLNSEFSIY